MFRQIKYQTGELTDVVSDMKKGNIPCMEVEDSDELEWVIGQLSQKGIYALPDMPRDNNARDRIKEPEFEFRVGFSTKPDVLLADVKGEEIMYIDFYFESFVERSYDPVGEM